MNEKIKNLLQNAHRRKITYAVITAMSIVAVLSVFFALERPGITVTKDSGEIKITEKLPDESETEIIDKDVQFNEQQQSNDITPDISYIPELSLAPKQMFAGSDYDTVVELDEENNCKYTFGYDYSLIIEPINAGTDCIARPLAERDTYLKDLVESIKFKNGVTKIYSYKPTTEWGSSSNKSSLSTLINNNHEIYFTSVCKDTLKHIDFSECTTLTDLGIASFYNCVNVYDVIDLSNCTDLKVIPYTCFEQTSNLSGVKLPSSIEKIDDFAFCISSTKSGTYAHFDTLDFKNAASLKSIGKSAFNYRTGFDEIDLSHCKELESIGSYAFEQAGSYTKIKSVNLSGLTKLNTINTNAFSYMRKVEKFNMSGCTSLEQLNSNVFTDSKKYIQQLDISNCPNLKSFDFSGFKALQSVDISGSAAVIPNKAFSGCTALNSIDLSDITSIGNEAFSGCTALKEINLTDKLTSIGSNAFKDCKDVETVNYNLSSTCTTGSNYLQNVGSNFGFNFIVGSNVDKIDKYVDGKYIKNIVFKPNDSITFETGAFSDYGKPLKSMADGTTKYKADDNGVLYSEDGSVLYFVPEKIQSLTVPETVKTIKSNAFAKAKKITVLKFAGNTKILQLRKMHFQVLKNLKKWQE